MQCEMAGGHSLSPSSGAYHAGGQVLLPAILRHLKTRHITFIATWFDFNWGENCNLYVAVNKIIIKYNILIYNENAGKRHNLAITRLVKYGFHMNVFVVVLFACLFFKPAWDVFFFYPVLNGKPRWKLIMAVQSPSIFPLLTRLMQLSPRSNICCCHRRRWVITSPSHT